MKSESAEGEPKPLNVASFRARRMGLAGNSADLHDRNGAPELSLARAKRPAHGARQ
jgi:hypothetical protein